MRRAAAHVLAACTAAAVISGCGGGDKPEAGKDEAAPAAYVTPKGAIKDLSDVTCEKNDAGVWDGAAKLTNGTDKDQTYVVRFSLAKNKTNEVLGAVEKEVRLDAGKSKDVELPSIHHAKATDGKVTCIQRVTAKS